MAFRRPIDYMFGRTYGLWTVLREVAPPKDSVPYARYVECRCACGTVSSIYVGNIKRGMSTSCGCTRADRMAAATRTHGRSKTREYKIWAGIKQRCLDPGNPSFANYGGRGITICSEWSDSFERFFADVGPAPSRKHTIERVQNNIGYRPGNVVWATRVVQANNTRRNRRLTIGGETLTMSQWARRAGIAPHALLHRLSRGWDPATAVRTGPLTNTTRVKGHRNLTHNGITRCVSEWARVVGIPDGVIRARLRMGWSASRALGEPVHRR